MQAADEFAQLGKCQHGFMSANGTLTVSGLSADRVGTVAGAAGITVLELAAEQASLEDAFVNLTEDAVEFRASTKASTEGEQS